jgi:hypothetical protein
MSSPAQIAANRANAQKSTGPRTVEGKETSKYNGLRHGLASPITVLPFENQDEYDSLYASFSEEHSPVGPTEQALVKQIADAQWKLLRLEKLEEQVFVALATGSQTEPNSDPFAAMAAALLGPGKHQQALNSLVRYQSTLNRQFLQSLKELKKYQNERRSKEEKDRKRQIIRRMAGIADRSQYDRKTLDLLPRDTHSTSRSADADCNVAAAGTRERVAE